MADTEKDFWVLYWKWNRKLSELMLNNSAVTGFGDLPAWCDGQLRSQRSTCGRLSASLWSQSVWWTLQVTCGVTRYGLAGSDRSSARVLLRWWTDCVSIEKKILHWTGKRVDSAAAGPSRWISLQWLITPNIVTTRKQKLSSINHMHLLKFNFNIIAAVCIGEDIVS